MAKWAHPDILDGGPLALKNGATALLLVSSYAPGDSYNVVRARRLAEVAMAPGDFTITSNGANRQVVTAAGKTGAASAASTGTDLHLVLTDGVSRVLLAADEPTNMTFDVGTGINFPQLTFAAIAPV